MKALSLTQPWATLVSISAKKIETRSWSTSWRGVLAIHAARGYPKDAQAFAAQGWAAVALAERGFGVAQPLPMGAVVAVARLAEVRGTGPNIRMPAKWLFDLTGQEQAFGDYSPDRFGWFLEDVRELAEPIPCRGSLGLWEVLPEVVAEIERQLALPAGAMRRTVTPSLQPSLLG